MVIHNGKTFLNVCIKRLMIYLLNNLPLSGLTIMTHYNAVFTHTGKTGAGQSVKLNFFTMRLAQ